MQNSWNSMEDDSSRTFLLLLLLFFIRKMFFACLYGAKPVRIWDSWREQLEWTEHVFDIKKYKIFIKINVIFLKHSQELFFFFTLSDFNHALYFVIYDIMRQKCMKRIFFVPLFVSFVSPSSILLTILDVLLLFVFSFFSVWFRSVFVFHVSSLMHYVFQLKNTFGISFREYQQQQRQQHCRQILEKYEKR